MNHSQRALGSSGLDPRDDHASVLAAGKATGRGTDPADPADPADPRPFASGGRA
jgi:hypothetical protein